MLVSESAGPLSESASLLGGSADQKRPNYMNKRSFGRNLDLAECTICRKFLQRKHMKKHLISAKHNTLRLMDLVQVPRCCSDIWVSQFPASARDPC